jgi:hypothetical protein
MTFHNFFAPRLTELPTVVASPRERLMRVPNSSRSAVETTVGPSTPKHTGVRPHGGSRLLA